MEFIQGERTIRYQSFGEPADVLRLERRASPQPGTGEIRVRMSARSINPSDLIPIRGAYAHRIQLPAVPGYEGVGVVEAVGRGAAPSLLGRRVLPLRGEGTWQDVVISPAEWAVPVPASIPDETAAQLFINPVTAWVVCTEVLQLKPGDVLVMNAGGSALGTLFAQLSTLLGFRFLAIIRRAADAPRLYAAGAWYVLDDSQLSDGRFKDRVAAVYELTGDQGAAASVDCIGGQAGAELVTCTATGGTIVSLGLLSGQPVNLSLVAKDRVRVRLFHLRHWMQHVPVETWQRTFQQMIGLVEQKRFKLREIEQSFELREVIQAVQAAEHPGRRGKILLHTRQN